MSNVKPTSKAAYEYLHRLNLVDTQAGQVFLSVSKSPKTRKEISELTGIPINAVCGRAKELLDKGSIWVSGTRRCSITGRRSEVLHINKKLEWD